MALLVRRLCRRVQPRANRGPPERSPSCSPPCCSIPSPAPSSPSSSPTSRPNWPGSSAAGCSGAAPDPGRRHRPPPRPLVRPRPNLLAGEDLPPAPPAAQPRQACPPPGGRPRPVRRKGFEATSIHDIAARAQLAVGGFFQHFASKRQLLLALMDDLLEKLSRLELQPSPSISVREGLRALLAHAFSHDLKYLGAYRRSRPLRSDSRAPPRRHPRLDRRPHHGPLRTPAPILRRAPGRGHRRPRRRHGCLLLEPPVPGRQHAPAPTEPVDRRLHPPHLPRALPGQSRPPASITRVLFLAQRHQRRPPVPRSAPVPVRPPEPPSALPPGPDPSPRITQCDTTCFSAARGCTGPARFPPRPLHIFPTFPPAHSSKQRKW